MNVADDRKITPEERAEINKRKMEVSLQKKTKQVTSLSEFKKEIGIPEKGKRI